MINGRKKIMVVDDSPPIRGLVSIILKGEGHDVIEAENGSEALLKLNGTGVDLIITDLKMPEMDGFELIRRLRVDDGYRDIPVIVLTGEFFPEDGRISGLDIDEVVLKPFIPKKLLDAVERSSDPERIISQDMEVLYGTDKAG